MQQYDEKNGIHKREKNFCQWYVMILMHGFGNYVYAVSKYSCRKSVRCWCAGEIPIPFNAIDGQCVCAIVTLKKESNYRLIICVRVSF